MPLRVRRKLPVLLFVLAAVLATAGIAAAANGGFTPEAPHSPNASRITSAYYLVLGLTAFVFVVVETTLAVFIWKYRSRGRRREIEGAQVHGHTRLELLWTAGPVVILAAIATFVFVKLPGIANAPAAPNPIHVTVEGHQFYWLFRYPNGAVSINDLHVPVGQVVDLKVTSADVIHSWWIPQLGGKIQAIPGRTNTTWFEADHTGVYQGQCAELCGLYHAAMLGDVVAEPEAAYRQFISSTATRTLGKQEFTGVCATCHGMQGTGGYGPDLTTNSILAQTSTLAGVVRNGVDNGRRVMPAVADTWTSAQIDALAAYVKKHVYKGATSGG
jgi:cytochrome c oxidase subunit II